MKELEEKTKKLDEVKLILEEQKSGGKGRNNTEELNADNTEDGMVRRNTEEISIMSNPIDVNFQKNIEQVQTVID